MRASDLFQQKIVSDRFLPGAIIWFGPRGALTRVVANVIQISNETPRRSALARERGVHRTI